VAGGSFRASRTLVVAHSGTSNLAAAIDAQGLATLA
jgi:hypothetical protein